MRTFAVAGALLAALAPQAADAWYLQVHNQIGYMAEQLMNSNARWMVGRILEPEYQGSVGRAASWADTVSKSTAPYSYGWHWISAKDSPPNECGLYYHRDCQEGGCVVSQIHNQTEILKGCMADIHGGRQINNFTVCQQALKWVIHFIGDVHEPMHTSEKAYGGNIFKVTFNGTKTNMHQTWDRWILYAGADRPDGFGDRAIDPFFSGLLARIKNDQYREPINTWNTCQWQVNRHTYCPEKWAQETNGIVCDYAYGRFVNETTDLYPEYSKGAFHIVEMQLAKAAYRLAGWLNTLATQEWGHSPDSHGLPGVGGTLQEEHNSDWLAQAVIAGIEEEEEAESVQRGWKIWDA